MPRINPWRLFTGAMVPNWLLVRTEISEGAKLCYARLAQHAGRKGYAYPEQETLAKELGISTRQVQRHLSKMIAQKLIETERVGLGQSNRYHFLEHPWFSRAGDDIDVASDTTETSPLERTDPSSPKAFGSESVEVIQKELPGDVTGLVRQYRATPGVTSSPKDGGVIAGLVGRHGAEAVRAMLDEEAPALAAAESPLLLLASRFRGTVKVSKQRPSRPAILDEPTPSPEQLASNRERLAAMTRELADAKRL